MCENMPTPTFQAGIVLLLKSTSAVIYHVAMAPVGTDDCGTLNVCISVNICIYICIVW